MKFTVPILILLLCFVFGCPGLADDMFPIDDNLTIFPTLNLTEGNLTPTLTPTPTPTLTIPPVILEEIPEEITVIPSLEPTGFATSEPTIEPTAFPTLPPAAEPSEMITALPTEEPLPTLSLPPEEEPLIPSGIEEIIPLSVSGNFSITSTPSGAAIQFDGASVGVTPLTIPVETSSPTPHEIILTASGYQDWTSSVDHNPAEGTTELITATLVPAVPNGSILVTSTPTGATVALDGSIISVTPYTFSEVIPGEHTISVTKDGYTPFSTNITVASGAQSVVSASLTPVTTTGSLTVETSPQGAVILLNGMVYGITPAHYNAIQAGTYNLQLVRYGYEPVSKTVEIVAGKENTVQVALPWKIPVTGTLSIRSFPSGGTVTVDGNRKGVTPVKIPGLVPDSYNVRVSIPGYLSWIGIVEVQSGRETAIYATLTPKGVVSSYGTLAISSDPLGASVSVDSQYQGKTPLTLQNVAVGTHGIVVAYPGYEPVSTTLQVTAGHMSSFSATLTPYQKPNLSPDLITLSDDAADYLTTYGRSRAIEDFQNPQSGFSRDNRYLITTDLDGVVLSDGENPNLTGQNLSESSEGKLLPGALITGLARNGGGFMYDTTLSKSPGIVSFLYIRPAISGVVIGAVTTVPDMLYPVTPENYPEMKDAVHAAVVRAREIPREDMVAELDTGDLSVTHPSVILHPFDLQGTDDPDQNGVSPARLLGAVASDGGGYVWIPVLGSSPEQMSLMLAYAEKVDDTWGIWASVTPEGREVIIMMDTLPVSV